MKTAIRMVTAALGGALCVAASMGLAAAASRSPTTMKPLGATSLDVGSKHVVGYFLNADGQCKLTLMIADRARDDDSAPSAQVLRLRLTVEPGRPALVDTTEGRLLQFACEPGAQAMNAKPAGSGRRQSRQQIIRIQNGRAPKYRRAQYFPSLT